MIETIFILSTLCAASALFLALKLKTDVLQNIDNGCSDNFWSYRNTLRPDRSGYCLYSVAQEK